MLNNKQFKLILENIQSREEIKVLLKKYHIDLSNFDIKNYTINDDGSVDIDGNINLCDMDLSELPFKFGKIKGNFICSYNQLTSLIGAPQEVGGNFSCTNNQLTNLISAPKNVEGNFDCSKNQLTSLKGVSQEMKGTFYCSNNQLTSLKDAPQKIGKNFSCAHNLLTSLIGAPKNVKGHFWCNNNQLTSLDGAPKVLLGGFWLRNNEWERLNPFKEQEQEKTLDDMIDTYGGGNYINVKEFLYKDNRLIKR